MKKHSATIHTLILFTLLFLISASGAYFFWRTISDERQAVFVTGREIATEAKTEDQANSLVGLLQSTAQTRSALDATILSSNGFVSFVESIEAIGKSQGVTMTDSLGTQPDGSSKTGTQFLSVQINLSGTWSQVIRTVSLIETLPYALSVSNFTLDKDLNVSTTKKSIWDASMTLNVEERTQ